jgi:hypothetical protein
MAHNRREIKLTLRFLEPSWKLETVIADLTICKKRKGDYKKKGGGGIHSNKRRNG